jgi:hypothetical protein
MNTYEVVERILKELKARAWCILRFDEGSKIVKLIIVFMIMDGNGRQANQVTFVVVMVIVVLRII